MPTAYLSPSQLQDLTNVSSAVPGSGDNGKALVWNWNGTTGTGQWQAAQVAYSNLSGAPTLGTIASQNANAVAITGGTAQNLTAVSQFANNASSVYTNSTYSSQFASHSPGFQGLRARGSDASPAGVLAGDRLFALTGIPRATASNWSPAGTGFFVVANQDGGAAPSSGLNAFRVACRVEILGVGLNNVQSTWMTLNGTTTAILSSEASISTTTGALTVAGGAGIAGALHVGGQINGLGAVQPGTVASPTAAGTQWQVRVDENYIYVCTQTGTQGNAAWKRVAISTWTP